MKGRDKGKDLQHFLSAQTPTLFPFFPSFLCTKEKSIFQAMQDLGVRVLGRLVLLLVHSVINLG